MAKKYTKIYMNHYDYGEQDFIICEVFGCSKRANSIHHLKKRARSGTDDIWNLIALCQPHHHKADNNENFNNELKNKKNVEFNRETIT